TPCLCVLQDRVGAVRRETVPGGYGVWISKWYEQLTEEWEDACAVFGQCAWVKGRRRMGILQDRASQTVATSIMSVKSRHAAWINSLFSSLSLLIPSPARTAKDSMV
ncbi:hypothetical protein E4T56_gene9163, partial [Termitomyces sp. T112]